VAAGKQVGWFVAAGVVLLLGIGGALYPGWQAATAVRTPVVLSAGAPTEVRLDREGLMIFGSEWTYPVNCTAADRDGTAIGLERVRNREEITMNGREWVGLLRSVEPVPAGSYTVTCAADPRGITFSAGARVNGIDMLLMLLVAVASIVIGATIAALLVLVGIARRRRVPS
jgi:hypothetical protein